MRGRMSMEAGRGLAALALAMALMVGPAQGQTWSAETCRAPDAKVTFSKCCGEEKFCSAVKDKASCSSGETQLFCLWSSEVNKCMPRPDDRSDVCCRGGKVGDACHSIAYKMECPKDWLVRSECCPDPDARKYSALLGGGPPGTVCCNAPCDQMMKANCTLDARCAPNKRSLAMTYNPYQTLGFFHTVPPMASTKRFGNLIQGTGLVNDDLFLSKYLGGKAVGMPYPYPYPAADGGSSSSSQQNAYDSSKANHVDEITVDDLFELLIEALQDDTDVKVYSAQIDSDPLFGKVTSGGFKANLNLPDADFFLNRIYGSPFGLSPPVMAAPSSGRVGQSLGMGYGIYGSTPMPTYPPYGSGGGAMYGSGAYGTPPPYGMLPSDGSAYGYPMYYGGGSGSYGGGAGPYGVMSGSYGGGASGPYGGVMSSYGGMSGGAYGAGSGTYGTGTGSYGTGTGSYGTGAGSYGTGAGSYGTGAGSYGTGAGSYGTGTGSYGTGTGSYGTGMGSYGTGTGSYGTGTGSYGTGTGSYGTGMGSYGTGTGSYGTGTGSYGTGTGSYGGMSGSYGTGTGSYGGMSGGYGGMMY